MAEQFYTILTSIGKAKIANASALGNKVNFTHFALGDGGGKYYSPTESQTELKNEVWRGQIGQIAVDEKNPNWIVIETIIPADQGGFMIREAGIFDDENNLLAVGKYPETYKPVVADGSAKDLYIRMILEVVNTSVVNLKVDPTIILATKKDIEVLEQKMDKKIENIDIPVTEVVDNLTTDDATKALSAKQGVELFQYVSNGKNLVATAITDKGVITSSDDTFQIMANNIAEISTGKYNVGDILTSSDVEIVPPNIIEDFRRYDYTDSIYNFAINPDTFSVYINARQGVTDKRSIIDGSLETRYDRKVGEDNGIASKMIMNIHGDLIHGMAGSTGGEILVLDSYLNLKWRGLPSGSNFGSREALCCDDNHIYSIYRNKVNGWYYEKITFDGRVQHKQLLYFYDIRYNCFEVYNETLALVARSTIDSNYDLLIYDKDDFNIQKTIPLPSNSTNLQGLFFVNDNLLYLVSGSSEDNYSIYLINYVNSNIVWRFQTDDKSLSRRCNIKDEFLFFSKDGSLCSINTGSVFTVVLPDVFTSVYPTYGSSTYGINDNYMYMVDHNDDTELKGFVKFFGLGNSFKIIN